MMTKFHYFWLFIAPLFFLGCASTQYVEKNSEILSQTVWAAKDSSDLARFDLSDKYINEASKLVPPPKHRIEIKAVYEK